MDLKKSARLLFWFITLCAFGQQPFLTIKTLNRNDEVFRQLIDQISENHKRLAQRKELLPLEFYLYQPSSTETLYTIAARLNINLDALASLNGLASPAMLDHNQPLLLPNLPALYLYEKDSEVVFDTARQRLDTQQGVYFVTSLEGSSHRSLVRVYPGARFSPSERLTFITGFFMWPITGMQIITSDYGLRIDPISHQGTHYHRGIDLRLAHGDPVFASRSGVVQHVGYNAMLGHHIILEHSQGYRTVYGHLSQTFVSLGETVRSGAKIGAGGSSGLSTGPHLHFEINKDGVPIDPKPFFIGAS
jgi:murein DD-endopeptidase MepM/ murein hydrolase activator NlpD